MLFTKYPSIVSFTLCGGTNPRNEESALVNYGGQGTGYEYGRAATVNWAPVRSYNPAKFKQ